MSSFIFSSLEMLMFAFTALMLGILIYQIKRVFRGLMAVTVPLIVYGFVICVVMSGLEKERVVGGIGIWCAVLLYNAIVRVVGGATLFCFSDMMPAGHPVQRRNDRTEEE